MSIQQLCSISHDATISSFVTILVIVYMCHGNVSLVGCAPESCCLDRNEELLSRDLKIQTRSRASALLCYANYINFAVLCKLLDVVLC